MWKAGGFRSTEKGETRAKIKITTKAEPTLDGVDRRLLESEVLDELRVLIHRVGPDD